MRCDPGAHRRSAAAALLLGAVALRGTEDETAELAILRDAAERGDVAAQVAYADRLATGRGVGRDLPAALEWWARAALQGRPDAMARVAEHLAAGEGVERDEARAVALWRRSADLGYAPSMYRLARALAEGRGGAADAKAAMLWLRRAAERGHPAAQMDLARRLEEGPPPDPAAAAAWYEQAAREGVVDAMLALARLHAEGRGVAADPYFAYVWCRLAALCDERRGAPVCDLLARTLSPTARFRAGREAAARAREWGLR